MVAQYTWLRVQARSILGNAVACVVRTVETKPRLCYRTNQPGYSLCPGCRECGWGRECHGVSSRGHFCDWYPVLALWRAMLLRTERKGLRAIGHAKGSAHLGMLGDVCDTYSVDWSMGKMMSTRGNRPSLPILTRKGCKCACALQRGRPEAEGSVGFARRQD